ncbi:hypothetical protein [Clostridium pasteurianum]|uniref:Uncharacterized protein n=1 Tax=Clostridium pasteurianum BC1 TaxID=86416 RepID=R4KBG4_CLOPA|nr:hypothetical protein [Clostridium pasteurianum]AGK97889.1 hypothetical protein Clopa_3061 [Clostridium pasteurianum BC1]
MKDPTKLISEINKLTNDQIAVGLSQDEKNELLAMLKSVDAQYDTQPYHNIIDFENCVSIPSKIQVLPQTRKFVFESCLICTTGQPVTVPIAPDDYLGPTKCTLYPIKIVGCIQYIAIADVFFNSECFIESDNNERTPVSLCPSPLTPSAPPKTSGISVQGSVCVDAIVGYTASSSTCSSTISRDAISVCLDPFTVSGEKILFSGKFILPAITNYGDIPSCSPTTCPIP